jgi:hypothetical protein
VEWTGGPHAIEVIGELETLAADDEVTTVLSPRDITDVEEYVPGAVKFRVRGIPFALRPLDTVGVEAELEKILNPFLRMTHCSRPSRSAARAPTDSPVARRVGTQVAGCRPRESTQSD